MMIWWQIGTIRRGIFLPKYKVGGREENVALTHRSGQVLKQ